MSKKLVAYFSMSGHTKSYAELIAKVENADLYEIKAKVPYTEADLDWRDDECRSSKEMGDLDARPEIVDDEIDMDQYDVIYLGFPTWWYSVPKIIFTFLEKYNFDGKVIVPFSTSAMSDIGDAAGKIEMTVKKAIVKDGEMFVGYISEEDMKKWADQF